jgi:hypothetical protein
MKNQREGYCYVCGDVVEEEKGIAEQIDREEGSAGWGTKKWVVRHVECQPPTKENKNNNLDNGY